MGRKRIQRTLAEKIPSGFKLRHTLRGHRDYITAIAWSPDGRMLVSPSRDSTIRLWDTKTGRLIRTLRGYNGTDYSVAWAPDGRMLASGAGNGIIRLWNISAALDTSAESSELRRTLEGHTSIVFSLAWAKDGRTLASGSHDQTIRLWNAESGELNRTLKGHREAVTTLAWSPDGRTLASGSNDGSIRLWDMDTGELLWTNKVHFEKIKSVAWTTDGRTLASGSHDGTIQLWDPETGRQMRILEGHTDIVTCVSFSSDNRILASKSLDGTVRLWRNYIWEIMAVLDEPGPRKTRYMLSPLAFHPTMPLLATLSEGNRVIRIWDLDIGMLLGATPTVRTVHNINPKVVLVGESGVGKSGLGIRIAEGEYHPTEGSTHGAQFWQIPVPKNLAQDVQAELTLWDLAGQPEYRLVHQLFLDDMDVALLLFDCSDPADPFRGVPFWTKVLRKQAPPHTIKFLVSARTDVSPVTVDRREIDRFLVQHELDHYLSTSAKTGEGVDELLQQILASIPWDKLPCTTTPRLFQVLRKFLLERKKAGDAFISMDNVRHEIRKRYTEREATQPEIDTVVKLLQAQGLVHRLHPTPKLVLVLLRPELINQYASSIIQAARNHPRGIGAIPEREVVCADLPITGFERLKPQEEKIALESTVELLIRHDLCFREMGMLIFPSQINVTRPVPIKEHPPTEVTYQFSGSVEAIYASLVVRLSYTDFFQLEDQWRYAAEFSREEHRLGFAMQQVEEGTAELEIYFYPGVGDFDRVTFIRFITDHLRIKGIDIQERIRLYCPKCGNEVENREAIEARVQASKLYIPCQYCDTSVIIPRSIEERYRSDRSYSQVQQQLAKTVEERTDQEAEAFKKDQLQYTREKDHRLHILHLSDIHLSTTSEVRKYRTQLEADLIKELKVSRLEYLIISGDIANHSTKEEYEVAFELIDGLVKRFGLDSSRVVVVPGNHDLNWDLSEEAYPFVPKRKLPDPLPEGQYIPAGKVGALLRDEEKYQRRFAHFSTHFYKKVYGGTLYPLDYAEQGSLHLRPDDRLLFLALNSCWEIDHHYRQRASINMDALSRALDQMQDSEYDDWLKIAVWHHPITGCEMMNDEFLERLAVHGFQICMHGHIHEAIEGYHKYDVKRGIHIIGAGTFGASTKEHAPGIPLQYNLLVLDQELRTITVETRKKEKPIGAWSADPRWGDKNNPVPRYTIELK